MKRKLLSILLTLCMVLTLLPTAALAVDYGDTQTESSTISVKIGDNTLYYLKQEDGWNAAVAATEAVTVTLLKDWTADLSSHSFGIGAGFGNQGYILVPALKTITLDLNDYTIDRGLQSQPSAVSEGEVIEVKGNLTLQNTGNSENGKITGANSSDGYGAVYVEGGTFNMEGGNITDNKANNTGSTRTAAAGGVYTSGTFNMTGGNITGNTGSGVKSVGGVYIASNGGVFTMTGGSITGNTGGGAGGVLVVGVEQNVDNIFTVGGTAKITGNQLTGGTTASNVLLQNITRGSNRTITCSTEMPLTSGAAIGVTTKTAPAVNAPVTITGDNLSTNYSSFFFSDNPAYETRNSGTSGAQVVQLAAPGAITIKVNDDLEYDGDSLSAAVAARGVSADDILTLTITAGKMTAEDWACFTGNESSALSNLEHFTVERAVTAVADIPDGVLHSPIFPNTIQTVDIPQVQKIGDLAFSACKRLVTAKFPAATAIGKGAFDSCNKLENANFPEVKTIGVEAFNSCFENANTGLKTANFPEATDIGDGAFYGCKILETANFPKAETIGEKAFNSCASRYTGLGTANFPEAKTIGTYAFECCTMLKTATFPKATTIGTYAFYGCTELATATFPKATTIEANAFKRCSKLATATFPNATTIGATAFENCVKLTKLTLGATPPTTVADAFTNCPGTRSLALAGENGDPLSVAAWTTAQGSYKAVADGNPGDGLWYGWIVPAAPTPTPATKPNATFTATGASSGTLSGLTANESYKYSVNGGSYYTDFTGATATIADGIDITNGVWVVKNGNNTTTIDSEPQKITITKAAAPTNIGKTDCTTNAQNNGKITGVTAAMEYKEASATTYTAISGTAVTKLAPATYNVRIKAAGTVLAGEDISVTIGSYNAAVIYEDDYIPPVQTTVESGKNVNAFDLKSLARESKPLTIIGKNGTKLLLDAESIKALADGSGSLNVIVSEAKGKLSSEQTAIVGANSVYELTATLNGKPITNFGGKVTVTLPYTLKSGEKAENVTVWYLATDGTLTKIPATYDAKTGLATFTVTHFSLYIVGVPEKSNNPFTDINSGNYYYDAVLWAVGKGITNGATATAFSPDGSCTRADMVTFLWRAMGSPEPKATNLFADVPANAYYSKAVMWAVEKGITLGTGKTEFSPQAIVNRSQTVTFLWRMAGNPKATATNAFTDVGIDAYYANAVLWAVEKNITDGTSAKTFSPLSPCSRGQIVTFLYRYLAK